MLRRKVRLPLAIGAAGVILVGFIELFDLVQIPLDKLISLILVFVGIMSIYLMLDREESDIVSLWGVEELFKYVTKRMGEAEESISDLTWGRAEDYLSYKAQQAYLEYVAMIEKVCQEKSIVYREIFSFPPKSHIDRAQKTFQKKLKGYNMRYYLFGSRTEPPPLISFMIIDSKEVIVAFYELPNILPDKEVRFYTKNPRLVNFFQEYYDTIWTAGQKLPDDEDFETAFEGLREALTYE